MNKKTKAKFEARAKIIKALAHPTRLFIVDELARKEQCVCKLTDMIGSDISTVSKHLSVLKCVLNFFGCVENVLKANARHSREVVSA